MARLAADPRLGLDADALDGLLADPLDFVGAAPHQVAAFVAAVEPIVVAHPEAATYHPAPIL